MPSSEAPLYGAQTRLAITNFPISGYRLPFPFLRALALIKSCAARVNGLPAVEAAAEQIVSGGLEDQFPVDVFQTGSGTSTNMNVNEVIARLAGDATGKLVHPNDDVNRGQSSNDTVPAALHIAAAVEVNERLLPAMRELESALAAKSAEFRELIKIGRTHLQDAVPMSLGQEFSGYAAQVGNGAERVGVAVQGLYELPLGGTAVGTGLNTPPGFAASVIELIAKRTGLPFREARNHFEAQAGKDAVCFLSGALRTYATALTKIANDIRWLGSGPRCGLGELRLPETQPGSSIMPGKVNPVIAESVLMVCAQVVGYDATVAWAAAAGNFELNVMMPVMAYDLLESIRLLAAASRNFARRCIAGLSADTQRIERYVEESLALATALSPEIGYDRAAEIVKKAYGENRTVRDVARAESGIPEDRLAELLDPRRQAFPAPG